MTATMLGYSSLFMGFAWSIQPRNYILFACHAFNFTAQSNQMRRSIEYQLANVPGARERLTSLGTKVAMILTGIGATIVSSGRITKALTGPSIPSAISSVVSHPAGPMTIFFWAPTTKWFLSANNLMDLNKPTEKISIAQQTALTLTGLIWTRYSFVITPVNYNLALVNIVLGTSSGYHLVRKIKADYFSKKAE